MKQDTRFQNQKWRDCVRQCLQSIKIEPTFSAVRQLEACLPRGCRIDWEQWARSLSDGPGCPRIDDPPPGVSGAWIEDARGRAWTLEAWAAIWAVSHGQAEWIPGLEPEPIQFKPI